MRNEQDANEALHAALHVPMWARPSRCKGRTLRQSMLARWSAPSGPIQWPSVALCVALAALWGSLLWLAVPHLLN